MYNKLERAKNKDDGSATKSVAQKNNNINFVGNNPAALAQRKLQEMCSDSPRTKQLVEMKELTNNHSISQHKVIQKGGSHGKKKKLNIKGTYTSGGGAAVSFNDRDENISIVKGHGGYTDEAALAEAWVRQAYSLGANDVVTITSYNFYTAR